MDNPADPNLTPASLSPAGGVPPVPKIPSTPPARHSPMKSIVLGLAAVLILVTAAAAGYFVQRGGLPFNLGKKAETPSYLSCSDGRPPASCNQDGYLCSTNCACNWNECKGVRIHYKCVNKRVEEYNYWDDSCNSSCTPPTCGGGGGSGAGACAGREGQNVCQGQSDNDGSVSVINCSGETRNYTCQTNSDRLGSVDACNAAFRTTVSPPNYNGMSVGPGQVGTCSTDAGGTCNIGQADILYNSSAICWDIAKNCSNCTPPPPPTSTPRPPTPTLTPRPPTPTPTVPTPTPTPPEPCCEGLEVYKKGSDPHSLAGLRPGDTLIIDVSSSNIVQQAATRIKKGSLVRTFSSADSQGTWVQAGRKWRYEYVIPADGAGNYEVLGFIKVNGHWK